MKRRIQIFMAVVAVAMGTATAALAYTHSGPFYDSAYNPQIWNYGIGVGNVSPSSPADGLTIPASLIGGFEESALRGLGSCLECEIWTGSPASLIQIGTDSYGSLKIITGVSTRFFSIAANVGAPQTSTHVTGEILCGHGATEVPASTTPNCGLSGALQDSYNTNGGPSFYDLPPSTIPNTNYATLAFVLSSCTAAGATSFPGETVLVDPSEIPGAGSVTSAVTCNNEVWTAYQNMGANTLTGGTGAFTYGGLVYHAIHMPQADCTNYEFNTFQNGNTHASYAGNKCYMAYVGGPDLQQALEHTLPVAFGTQTALVSHTLSPALTSTPNATNLLHVRTYVDQGSQSFTDEWNCLLQPTFVACPTSFPPPPVPTPAGCFNAPEPNTGESFDDYRLRVQNNGYTGTVVETSDPNYPAGGSGYPNNSPAAGLGVGTATGVGAMGAGGTVTMAYVSSTGVRVPAISWRGTIICPTTTTEVDIYDVPASGTGGTGGGSNSLPAVDFSPITSVSYGSAFPFGMFTWLNGLFVDAACNPAPYGGCNDAPTFTITKPGGGSLFVDLGSPTWVSTWRSPVFDVLDFLMVAGAVWFIAMRVIGIGGGSGGDEE